MVGNWATGKLRMVSEPTSTRTMEITIATMGRLMKNLDIGLRSLRLGEKRLGLHFHSRSYLLHSLDNYTFSWLYPFGNNPLGSDLVADLDGTDAHFVLTVHHRNLIPALHLPDGTLGTKKRAFPDSHPPPTSPLPSITSHLARLATHPTPPAPPS